MYFRGLQVEYRKIFNRYEGNASSFSFIYNARNIDDFFLDDNLPYIFESRTKQVMEEKIELFLLPIGPYRSISSSIILDSLHNLKHKLLFDQLIELCFIASFHNSVLQLDKCLTQMVINVQVSTQNEEHPYFTWHCLSRRFFASHQGGKYPRFSPGSNTFTMVFDATEKEETASKLSNVVLELISWIDFINSYYGTSSASDIPFFVLKNKMSYICENVKKAINNSSLEFGSSKQIMDLYACLSGSCDLFSSDNTTGN